MHQRDESAIVTGDQPRPFGIVRRMGTRIANAVSRHHLRIKVSVISVPSASKSAPFQLSKEIASGKYCTGCQACAIACPTGAIQITTTKGASDAALVHVTLRLDACFLCGLCVEACKSGALTMQNGPDEVFIGKGAPTLIMEARVSAPTNETRLPEAA